MHYTVLYINLNSNVFLCCPCWYMFPQIQAQTLCLVAGPSTLRSVPLYCCPYLCFAVGTSVLLPIPLSCLPYPHVWRRWDERWWWWCWWWLCHLFSGSPQLISSEHSKRSPGIGSISLHLGSALYQQRADDGISARNQANTNPLPNVGLMLAHRLRRWSNINPPFGRGLVFAGTYTSGHLEHPARNRIGLVRGNS